MVITLCLKFNYENNRRVIVIIIDPFLFLESHGDDLHFPTNANDPANVYRKVKTSLDVSNKLKELGETLSDNVDSLKDMDQEIMRLAHEIKGQAKAALVEG